MQSILLTLSILALAIAEDVLPLKVPNVTTDNANHIFNTLHSSMRQWGSSWNHNGMSFFMARVPADTELYHGSGSADSVTGLEWLAFEPEHALTFARKGGPHQNRTFNPPPPPPPQMVRADGVRSSHHNQIPLHEAEHLESPENPPYRPPMHFEPGFLHTYRTKHPLSLLYIDGVSAGKSTIGTLDSQNYLLLNWTTDHSRAPMFDEADRAKSYCDMARTKWHGHIDGVLRMEMGFEVILCDFEKYLDAVDVVHATNSSEIQHGTSPIWDQGWWWYRGIAARFNGIGTNRVTLDYNDFVTAHTYPVELYANGTDHPPRLNDVSLHDLAQIRSDVDAMIQRHPRHQHRRPDDHHPSRPLPLSTDWQAVADMLVTRYADVIPYFATITDRTTLHNNIEMLMRPFIDFANRSVTTEIARCTAHFLPTEPPRPRQKHHKTPRESYNSTARAAVQFISHTICATFFSILSQQPVTATATAQATLTELAAYLDWTVWRSCPARCGYDEVCFIPVWPVGTVEDRARGVGQCLNVTGFHEPRGRSYWGMPGGMPPPPRDEEMS